MKGNADEVYNKKTFRIDYNNRVDHNVGLLDNRAR